MLQSLATVSEAAADPKTDQGTFYKFPKFVRVLFVCIKYLKHAHAHTHTHTHTHRRKERNVLLSDAFIFLYTRNQTVFICTSLKIL